MNAIPQIDAALLSEARTLAAYLIFFGSYFVFALGKFPGMKIDRPGAAIIGAVLMVAFRIVSADDALRSIDFATIVLLFAMMVVVANLRLGRVLRAHRRVDRPAAPSSPPAADGHPDLRPVVRVSRERHRLPGHDSVRPAHGPAPRRAAGPISGRGGDRLEHRQRRHHHRQSAEHADRVAVGHLHISTSSPTWDRLRLAGLLLNWALIYWFCLRGARDRAAVAEVLSAPEFQHEPMRKKPVAVLVVVLAGFLAGVPPAMMAAIGAALLLITRTVDPQKVYQDIDWGLLIFFVGLFVIVAGADRAGLTATLLQPTADWDLYRIADLRAGDRGLVERRQQRPRGHAPANARAQLSRPARRLVDAGDGVDAGRKPDDYRVGRQHHRGPAAPPPRACRSASASIPAIGVPVTVATLAWGVAWLWITGAT